VNRRVLTATCSAAAGALLLGGAYLAVASGTDAPANGQHISVDAAAGVPRAHAAWPVTLRIVMDGRPFVRAGYHPTIWLVDEHDALLGGFRGAQVAPGEFRVWLVFPHAGAWRYVIPDPATGEYWFFAAPTVSRSLAATPASTDDKRSVLARVGPGTVAATVAQAGYTLQVLVEPNRVAAPNNFALKLSRHGQPVRRADVTLYLSMLDMLMPNQQYRLTETKPGIYTRSGSALIMVGHWALAYTITPNGGKPFTALIVDHVAGRVP
jgi:hypothetical protein